MRSRKPKLPVHALVTADQPLVRFIGGDQLADNLRWFEARQQNCRCGSNSISLICLFIRRTTAIRASRRKNLAAATLAIPDLPAPPDWPEQDALF